MWYYILLSLDGKPMNSKDTRLVLQQLQNFTIDGKNLSEFSGPQIAHIRSEKCQHTISGNVTLGLERRK